jgi:N-acetylglucosaminyldiphosphoundecaprenol N-acetyl-beta-D-mannosaminyltransferase
VTQEFTSSMQEPSVDSRTVVGMRVDATSYSDASARICAWAEASESRYVCVAAVNNVINGHDDPSFQAIMNAADLVTPDGKPLAWALRILGVPAATQVTGTHLTEAVCRRAARAGLPIGLYGGTPDVLVRLERILTSRFGGLRVVYREAPPFRPPTPEEDAATVSGIRASGARILFVGIGAPKQERWMASHRDELPCVMLGIGAAFDFLSGQTPRAPRWMRRLALEWLYRLLREPRRLWRRYLVGNPRFVALFTLQLVRGDPSRSTA